MKTKALISCAVTAQLICVFVFAYTKIRFSHDTAHFSVYMFPVPEDKSGQQVVDSLQRQVEQLGAVKTGNFCVDCETYQSNQQIGRLNMY